MTALSKVFVTFVYNPLQLSGRNLGQPRRVVAKVEWHPGELYPRVGFIVTNLGRPAERVVAFYNQRGTAEQWIKEGKNAIRWTRLSCRRFDHNAVRLQLHALAYNLGNFMRTLALPDAVEQWSLTSLREKLIKIGAKIVRHGRYVTFQMAEVVIPRDLFADILRLRRHPAPYRSAQTAASPGMSDGTPFLRVAADRIGAPGSARIAGKNAIPRHQRRQLVLNHPDRREDGCHSKANCTSSGFEPHPTGWEVSIWEIPIQL